jgi:hypothetical protein
MVKKPYSPLPGHNYDSLVRESEPPEQQSYPGIDPDKQLFPRTQAVLDAALERFAFPLRAPTQAELLELWKDAARALAKERAKNAKLTRQVQLLKGFLRQWETAERDVVVRDDSGWGPAKAIHLARVPEYALKPTSKKQPRAKVSPKPGAVRQRSATTKKGGSK